MRGKYSKFYYCLPYYLKTRKGVKQNEPLFITDGKGHRGERLSTRSIQDVCKQSLRAIGLDSHEYSAHSLRHTTASIEEEIRLQKNPEALLDEMF